MGTGTVSISDLPAGVIAGCGSGCLSILSMTPIWKMGWWTAPSCVRTPAPRERQKNGGQEQQALGRSRGGFSTKIHVTVDGLGNPLRLALTAGQRHDIIMAHDMTVDLDFDAFLGDRSYGAQAFVDELIAKGIEVVVPPKANAKTPRDYDAWRYRERALIECFIGKIKHFRRVFSRFDKLARRYLGFLQLTASLIWLR